MEAVNVRGVVADTNTDVNLCAEGGIHRRSKQPLDGRKFHLQRYTSLCKPIDLCFEARSGLSTASTH
jgi:hypothetical protein